jgi:hypothetical protein
VRASSFAVLPVVSTSSRIAMCRRAHPRAQSLLESNAELPGDVLRKLRGLVEAAFALPRRMQGHGNEQLRQGHRVAAHVFRQQCAQHAAIGDPPAILEIPHQVIERVGVAKRCERAIESR